jgi:TRAP-type mannitol/chloroaromatic compound transport system permease small subunit
VSIARRLDLLGEWTGRVIAWVMVPMVVVQFVIVALRYVFDLGWIWMQEGVLWMHAATFMLATAYTLHHDEHVRVDIFYRKLTGRGRAMVDVLGHMLLLLPMMIFLIIVSWDYVSVSWSIHEGSREAGGLPYPFVPVLKSLIPLTAGLVCVQSVASLLGGIGRLMHSEPARPPDGANS